MNERNLSRRLSGSVVDALKAHGHILVVKGGATALMRELDELMAPEIALIEPRLKPHTPLVGEPTSTFGDETVDQAVEDMVLKLTHALMNSDHVEDVFAEDAVIRRDIFRAVRDGLREPPSEVGGDGGDDADHASVTVKLDALGYVAATAGRRADPSTLRQALDRAASVAGARFSGFSPELREATFRLEGDGVDERLELEEAVADELTDLVEQGVVELPTVERRIDLGRPLPPSEQRALRGRIASAAEATLLRSGCAAEWEIADARTLRVLFTPLSEQDARGVDAPTSAFAREVAALLVSRSDARASAAPNGEHPTREVAPPSRPPAKAPTPARAEAEPSKSKPGENGRAGLATGAAKPRAKRTAKETAKPSAPAAAVTKPETTESPKRTARKTAAKAPSSSRKAAALARKTSPARDGAASGAKPRAGSTGKRPSPAKTTKAPAKKR